MDVPFAKGPDTYFQPRLQIFEVDSPNSLHLSDDRMDNEDIPNLKRNELTTKEK